MKKINNENLFIKYVAKYGSTQHLYDYTVKVKKGLYMGMTK